MPMASTTTAITALSYGLEVEEMRALGVVRGHVLAILSNAMYLQSDTGHIVCVAGSEAEDGPLTLRVSHLRSLLDALRLRPDARFSLGDGGIEIGCAARIELGQARAWKVTTPDQVGSKVEREIAARELERILAERSPAFENGSAGPSLQSLADQQLESKIASLARAIRQRHAERIRGAALSLLGLGPGLTPSGDDVVMGAVAMLVWRAGLGEFPAVAKDGLVQAIPTEAPNRTNSISARLLHNAW